MPFGGNSAVVNEIKTDTVGRFSGKGTGGRSDRECPFRQWRNISVMLGCMLTFRQERLMVGIGGQVLGGRAASVMAGGIRPGAQAQENVKIDEVLELWYKVQS